MNDFIIHCKKLYLTEMSKFSFLISIHKRILKIKTNYILKNSILTMNNINIFKGFDYVMELLINRIEGKEIHYFQHICSTFTTSSQI